MYIAFRKYLKYNTPNNTYSNNKTQQIFILVYITNILKLAVHVYTHSYTSSTYNKFRKD